jgi:hypothetical protein
MSALFIDGDLFVVEDGVLERFASGKDDGWKADLPGDDLLRPAPKYAVVAGGLDRRAGVVYAYDKANGRIVAIDKANGDYKGQYRPAGDAPDWADVRAIAVTPGVEDAPATLMWISKDGLHQTLLEAVPDVAAATPAPSAAASPSPAKSSPKPTTKPTKKP